MAFRVLLVLLVLGADPVVTSTMEARAGAEDTLRVDVMRARAGTQRIALDLAASDGTPLPSRAEAVSWSALPAPTSRPCSPAGSKPERALRWAPLSPRPPPLG